MAECAVFWVAEATDSQKKEIKRILNELAEVLEKRDQEIKWYKAQIDWYKKLVNSILESEDETDAGKV